MTHRLKSRIFNERVFIYVMLFLTMVSFFTFGYFHLGKFETTDEHLWKYDRIGQYWQALSDHDWEKMYINDKPGITVALISGIGLLSESHPEQSEKKILPNGQSSIFEAYDQSQSETINIVFRLPILIFSTIALLGFFFLLRKAFRSSSLALFGVMFIAFNPILLGISQIINPDSFFWIFGGLAMLAYISLLNTGEKKFLLLCGVLTGFALLSKYTAFSLFLFYGIFFLAKAIFQDPIDAQKTTLRQLFGHLTDMVSIFIISILVFSLFLPAVFTHPEYIFKGISQFFNAQKTAVILAGCVSVIGIIFLLRDRIGSIFFWLASRKRVFLMVVTTLFLLLVFISLLNAFSKENIVPVSALRDAAYANEPKEFNFKPLLDRKDGSWSNTASLFLMESYPLVFSLSPLIFVVIILTFVRSFRRTIPHQTATVLFSVLLFTLLYLFSALNAKIVTNARYLIILYPLFSILVAVSLADFLKHERCVKARILLMVTLFLAGNMLLFSIRPFYFSYTNFLLPRSSSIHDSWGHGSYEAAAFLNALPNAQNLVIWSNSDTVCRFFQGKCLKSRHIDLSRVTPDFFVISKRGVIKTSNRFTLENNPHPEKDSDYYFATMEKNSVWELLINDRPDNFIKIIPFEK